jgi:hypothetical protein
MIELLLVAALASDVKQSPQCENGNCPTAPQIVVLDATTQPTQARLSMVARKPLFQWRPLKRVRVFRRCRG